MDIGLVKLDRPNPVCMREIGEATCGYCVWSIKTKPQFVGENPAHHLLVGKTRKPWSQVRAEAALVPPETVGQLKAYIINECKQSGKCDQKIKNWRVKVDALDSLPDALTP
jgi:hypothetical protein